MTGAKIVCVFRRIGLFFCGSRARGLLDALDNLQQVGFRCFFVDAACKLGDRIDCCLQRLRHVVELAQSFFQLFDGLLLARKPEPQGGGMITQVIELGILFPCPVFKFSNLAFQALDDIKLPGFFRLQDFYSLFQDGNPDLVGSQLGLANEITG